MRLLPRFLGLSFTGGFSSERMQKCLDGLAGESQTQHFTVSNDGGLGTEVEIVRETNSPSFTFSHESVSLKPYSKKAIKVTFSPEEDQGYEEGVKLRFKNDGKELRSALTGRGVPLPVILERGDVDFQVCFVGKVSALCKSPSSSPTLLLLRPFLPATKCRRRTGRSCAC